MIKFVFFNIFSNIFKAFSDSLEIFEYSIIYLNSLQVLNFENFMLLANSTNKIEYWAVYLRYLLDNNDERQKNVSNIKAFFSKKLLKNSNYWHTNYLEDFFEWKLMKSMDSKDNRLNGTPSFMTLNFAILFKKIEILANFFCSNMNLIPITIDFREVDIFSIKK